MDSTNSLGKTARLAALLYVVMGFGGYISIMYIPQTFVVIGDAAATANKIVSSPMLYRFGIISDLVNQVFFIFLALTLYRLFKDLDRGQARLLVAFVLVQVAASFAIMLTQIAPLVLLGGADYLSAFDKAQLDAMVLAVMNLRGLGIGALSTYMGIWLLPFGVLVYRSGFIPRILGVFLIVACFAYLVTSLTVFLLPDYRHIVFTVAMPFCGLGEVSIVLWLLIKGVTVRPLDEPAS